MLSEANGKMMLKTCGSYGQASWKPELRSLPEGCSGLAGLRWRRPTFRKPGQALSPCSASRSESQWDSSSSRSQAPSPCEGLQEGMVDVEEGGGVAEAVALGIVFGVVSCWGMAGGASAATDSLASGHAQEAMSSVPLFSISEGEDFWANMANYGRFFISVLTGTVYVALKPIGRLLKNPVTGVLVIGGAVVLYFGLKATLASMLGLSDFEYNPASLVTSFS